MANDEKLVDAFVEELDREIHWEWRWEKKHRRWTWAVNWAGWVARLLILALTTYQLNSYSKGPPPVWLLGLVVVLSLLNLGLPLLAVTFRFQQRQEVHDRNAREYSVIRLEVVTQQIALAEAVQRFKELRRQPTEVLIRRTP